jgi:hypothetical protein
MADEPSGDDSSRHNNTSAARTATFQRTLIEQAAQSIDGRHEYRFIPGGLRAPRCDCAGRAKGWRELADAFSQLKRRPSRAVTASGAALGNGMYDGRSNTDLKHDTTGSCGPVR